MRVTEVSLALSIISVYAECGYVRLFHLHQLSSAGDLHTSAGTEAQPGVGQVLYITLTLLSQHFTSILNILQLFFSVQ